MQVYVRNEIAVIFNVVLFGVTHNNPIGAILDFRLFFKQNVNRFQCDL